MGILVAHLLTFISQLEHLQRQSIIYFTFVRRCCVGVYEGGYLTILHKTLLKSRLATLLALLIYYEAPATTVYYFPNIYKQILRCSF